MTIGRALVTGGEGFVGKALVSRLIDNGWEVDVLDVSTGNDITSWDVFKNLEPVDVVYHLAALMYVPYSWSNPREVFKVNVDGTLNTIEYARRSDVKRLIFASSYLYGQPKYLPIDESHPICPNNPYAWSKFIGENICRAYHDAYQIPCIIFRPFNIYGPNGRKNMLIPKIVEQLRSKKIELYDSEPKRDYVYIDDVISAYIQAADSSLKNPFEIINIASGSSYSVKEIVDIILATSKKSPEVRYSMERRPEEIMDTRGNPQRAKDVLDWIPHTTLEEGIKKILEQSENC